MAALPLVHAGRAAGAAAVAKVLNGDLGDPSQLLEEYPKVAEAVQTFSADLVRHASELDDDEQRWLEYTARNMDRATESAHSALQTAEAFRKVLEVVQPGAQVRDEVQKVFNGCEKILQIEVSSVQDSFEQCKKEWASAPQVSHERQVSTDSRDDEKRSIVRSEEEENNEEEDASQADADEEKEDVSQEEHADMLIDEALEGVPSARQQAGKAAALPPDYDGMAASDVLRALERMKRKEGEEDNEWQRQVTARVAHVCWFVTAVIIVLRNYLR